MSVYYDPLGIFSFEALYAGTGSESIDDLPFRIIIPEPVSLEQMGQQWDAP